MKNYGAATVEPLDFLEKSIRNFSQPSSFKQNLSKHSSSESLLDLLDSTIERQESNLELIISQNTMNETHSNLKKEIGDKLDNETQKSKKNKHREEVLKTGKNDNSEYGRVEKMGKRKYSHLIELNDKHKKQKSTSDSKECKKKHKYLSLSETDNDTKKNRKYSKNFEIAEVCGPKNRKDYFIVQSEDDLDNISDSKPKKDANTEGGIESTTKRKKSKNEHKDSNLSETDITTVTQSKTGNIENVNKKSRKKHKDLSLSKIDATPMKNYEGDSSLCESKVDYLESINKHKKSKKRDKHSSLSENDIEHKGDINQTKKHKRRKDEDVSAVQINDKEIELLDHKPKKKKKEHKEDTHSNDNEDIINLEQYKIKKKKHKKIKDSEDLTIIEDKDSKSEKKRKSNEKNEQSIKSPKTSKQTGLSKSDNEMEKVKKDNSKKKDDENNGEDDLADKIQKLYSRIISPSQIAKDSTESSKDETDIPEIIKRDKARCKRSTGSDNNQSKNHKKLNQSLKDKEEDLSSKIDKMCSSISDLSEVKESDNKGSSDDESDLVDNEKDKSKKIIKYKIKKKSPTKQSLTDEKEYNSSSNLMEAINESFDSSLDAKQLSEEDIQTLLNLSIFIPWKIPPSHEIETRVSSHPTREQQQSFKDLTIKMKTGPYTKEEDDKIKENWLQFCKEHDLQPNPMLFFQQKMAKRNILSPEERLKFVRYLGKDLEQRTLFSIYTRFQVLYKNTKKGRFTPEEDNIILTYSEHSDIANRFSFLETVLNRSRQCLKKRYEVLIAKESKITWDLRLMEDLVKNLIKVTNIENIEQLKDFDLEIEHWKQVEKKMGIPATKLRVKWISNLYPQLFIEDCNNLDDIRLRLINKLHNINEADRKNLNWTEVAQQDFPGITGSKLSRMFSDIVAHYVPAALRDDFRACIGYLKEVFKNCHKKSKRLSRLVYKDNRLQKAKRFKQEDKASSV
ncbi:hypothetical protein ILUMI_20422 [Ignelater luminosus]|uniref:Uncharacterized protein n=1 Tax=Ignelater luminosus TaxID=2038154 RepID=A0A8K0G4K9_IGNLU|nr:hypothetical protein ILUMI_20422 [Ignelater luminosus]